MQIKEAIEDLSKFKPSQVVKAYEFPNDKFELLKFGSISKYDSNQDYDENNPLGLNAYQDATKPLTVGDVLKSLRKVPQNKQNLDLYVYEFQKDVNLPIMSIAPDQPLLFVNASK